jgi:hypothetical protein
LIENYNEFVEIENPLTVHNHFAMIGSRSTTNTLIELYTQDAKWNNYSSWRNLLKLPPPIHNLQAVQQFWTEALIILDNAEVGTVQHLAQDLTSRNLFGYQYIEAVLDISHTQHSVLEYSQSFLLLISHKALLDCMSIQSTMNDLYRIIDGKRRERTVAFLIQICSDLLAECEAKSCSVEALLAATTTALCEAVNHDQQVIFNEKIPDLLVLIERIIFQAQIPEESKSYPLVMNRLQRLQRTLCRLKASADTSFTATLKQHDRLDITKVEILPTYADIRGIAPKAVPSISFALAGVERLLDFHFRLLRHDSLGIVEKQLSKLLKVLRNDANVDFKSSELLKFGKEGFFVYDNVYIRKLLFNQRCGLEAQFCFRLPQQFGNQPKFERISWGKERRPMQLGSLICLVTIHAKMKSIVFFTISAIKGSPGISSDHQHITVTARVAEEESQKRVDHLLQLTWQQKGVRSILVEFPGVLLPTFIPILKNLQQMQRESWLPFQQWIVPQSYLKTPTEILPPLYARVTGFFFSLRNLLINKAEDFKLRPNHHRNDVWSLESQTSLDQGQCEAIITALTHEFALVRGPPGTGKSYIGLQLVKALLENKAKAQLGPIIVVYVIQR